jgi:hypothetical protein
VIKLIFHYISYLHSYLCIYYYDNNNISFINNNLLLATDWAFISTIVLRILVEETTYCPSRFLIYNLLRCVYYTNNIRYNKIFTSVMEFYSHMLIIHTHTPIRRNECLNIHHYTNLYCLKLHPMSTYRS